MGKRNPRSDLVCKVSTMVLITVLKITTESGSPWLTPSSNGMIGVDQLVISHNCSIEVRVQ